ncbi:hypothetical protein GWK47_032828 [Chionoecetes opilio]|uniref:Uncharacterized protein n=1 Tax=Chionoecetes opilio TaxID=41210 RepID=A0A8J4YJI6_CHIOP|nr:hypothetical protein GWK47_032828 [Chionoecetes opilio]
MRAHSFTNRATLTGTRRGKRRFDTILLSAQGIKSRQPIYHLRRPSPPHTTASNASYPTPPANFFFPNRLAKVGGASCGVCSQAHASEQCIRRHKARQLMTARCPNCSGGHHAWSPRCPERLRRLSGGGRRLQGGGDRPGRQGSFVPAPLPSSIEHGGVRVHLRPTSRGRGD